MYAEKALYFTVTRLHDELSLAKVPQQVAKTPFPIPCDAALVAAINNAWSEITARITPGPKLVANCHFLRRRLRAEFKRVEIGGADFPQRRPKKSLLHAQTTPRV